MPVYIYKDGEIFTSFYGFRFVIEHNLKKITIFIEHEDDITYKYETIREDINSLNRCVKVNIKGEM